MVLKPCPVCNQQVPVACKSCFCGHIFFTNRRAKSPSPPVTADQNGSTSRRRAERPKKVRTDYYGPSAFEHRMDKQLSTNSSRVRERSASFGGEASPKKRKPGRPKSTSGKSNDDEKEKKEEDVYATLSEDKAFIYSIILDEINCKLQKQWRGPTKDKSVVTPNGVSD
ncbi:UPF0547 protein C16orf87 homolog [Anneissia japonica]|uniref:UPF0547 protein C16orf87 homolog n=1 Tax=Anneissia japonica TaxID=1529436 RepID=UPI0014256AF6|nr:UPF0547 protein C16orf87 homolog [Anneissia japonica]